MKSLNVANKIEIILSWEMLYDFSCELYEQSVELNENINRELFKIGGERSKESDALPSGMRMLIERLPFDTDDVWKTHYKMLSSWIADTLVSRSAKCRALELLVQATKERREDVERRMSIIIDPLRRGV